MKWRQRHTTEAVVIGVTGRPPARQALVPGSAHRGTDPGGGREPAGRGPAAPGGALLLHATSAEMRELPGTVGGLPGADPVHYLPVAPEVVVEIEVDQGRLEFGRYRHRPCVRRVRGDLTPEMVGEA